MSTDLNATAMQALQALIVELEVKTEQLEADTDRLWQKYVGLLTTHETTQQALDSLILQRDAEKRRAETAEQELER